jgi:hypothetical protein
MPGKVECSSRTIYGFIYRYRRIIGRLPGREKIYESI